MILSTDEREHISLAPPDNTEDLTDAGLTRAEDGPQLRDAANQGGVGLQHPDGILRRCSSEVQGGAYAVVCIVGAVR